MTTEQKKGGAGPESNEPFPISVLCNFISPYKGERETLTAFLTNCQNALDLASPSQKSLLTKYILSRMEGKAQIACSNKVFDDFNQLKLFLKQNFGEKKHYNHLLLDLQSCRQQPNESVAQFTLRIEGCLTALQSEIYNSESLKKDLSGRIAMTEDLALFTFSLGLQPRLSNNVRCRNPKSLNDAINMALEEEKLQTLLYKTTNKPKCKICGKPGHSDTECYTKQKSIGPPRGFPNPRPQTSPNHSGSHAFCRYCKNKGHDITQCRKRKYNNEKYNVHNDSNNRADMLQITYEPRSQSAPSSPTPYHIPCENTGESDRDLN